MDSRRLIAILAGTGSLLLAAGLLATPAAAAAAKAPVAAPVKIALDFPVYDSVIDPATAAMRAALADAGTEGSFLEKRDAAGVAEYYSEQGYLPTWTTDGHLTVRANEIINRLNQADSDGLDADTFKVPIIGIGNGGPADLVTAARVEVRLSTAIVRYAREAHSGRLDPNDLSPNLQYEAHLVDPVAVLANLAGAADPAAALASYNPQNVEFQRLRDKLVELRDNVKPRPPVVPAGKLLKLGMKDPRVIVLRARLNVTTPADDPTLFDADVDAALKAYQQQAGMKADGILGSGVLGALNAATVDPVAAIVDNMEKWRWMPEDLGKFYVRVNIPNFDLDVYRDGKVVFNTRIVDGQVDKQTPIFSNKIQYVDVNPVWNIPSSIAIKEMLPQIQANPGALRGYQVFANLNGHFQAVDPYMIDWQTVDMRRIQIKQPPGEKNALGSIKFMFPNPFDVYLHDTPLKSLFAKDYRAFSHGCMRVQNPWDFAAVLLQDDPKVTVAQLKKLVGGPETQVDLTHDIPVHITYFTAWVDDNGKLETRPDLYGHDKEIEAGLAALAPKSG